MPRVRGWVWLSLLAAAAAAEAAAFSHHEGTASEHIRRLAGVDPVRPWRPVGVVAIVAGCAWLAWHLAEPPHEETPP